MHNVVDLSHYVSLLLAIARVYRDYRSQARSIQFHLLSFGYSLHFRSFSLTYYLFRWELGNTPRGNSQAGDAVLE
jgi:hypothetical protein